MAGFELTLYGRIWVTPKAKGYRYRDRKTNRSQDVRFGETSFFVAKIPRWPEAAIPVNAFGKRSAASWMERDPSSETLPRNLTVTSNW
jgi:hypothetical protein